MAIFIQENKKLKISEGIGTVKVFFHLQIFIENRICNGLKNYDIGEYFNHSSERRANGGKTRAKTNQVVVCRQ
jgi:hypothetical protein